MKESCKRSRTGSYTLRPYNTSITNGSPLCLYKGYAIGFFVTSRILCFLIHKIYSSTMIHTLRQKFNYRFRKLEWRFRSLVFIFFITSIYFILLYKRQNPGMTPLMGIRFVEQIAEKRPIILKYTWVPIQKISDYSMYAVMAITLSQSWTVWKR